ncbi:MAG: S8 family serine peptidase [Chloroflexi bacterium]|nr:S8 family serine peptidase [Chloroflexota bacterium]
MADAIQMVGSAGWNSNGFTGRTIRIGVIDWGFRDYTSHQGQALPAVIDTSCHDPVNGNIEGDINDAQRYHGTGVLEIIHALAPEAEVSIARVAGFDAIDNVVDCFMQPDKVVQVVNMSMQWRYDGPGDGTGFLNSIVSNATSNGNIVWVQAAGNRAQQHWRGTFNDTEPNSVHNFNGVTETMKIPSVPQGQQIEIQLRWSDNWNAPCNDFDIFLYNSPIRLPGNRVGSGGADTQTNCTGGSIPYERLTHTPSSGGTSDYYLEIVRATGSTNNTLEVMSTSHVIDGYTPSYSLMNPADNKSTGTLTVGAVPISAPTTITAYSSQGPTSDGTVKPDVVAPVEYAITSIGSPVTGTSAAAPLVAGLAALVRQAQPSANAATVAGYIRQNVQDLGASGPDSVFGQGRVSFGAAPAALPAPPYVFVGTNGNGLIAREAGGWVQKNSGHDIAYVDVLLIPAEVPNLIYIWGRTSSLLRKGYRSTDGGATWTLAANTPYSTNEVAARPGADTLYAASAGWVYRSNSGGAWSGTSSIEQGSRWLSQGGWRGVVEWT